MGRPPRRHFSPQQIAEYLRAQPASGLTIAAFCQQHGFHPSVFHGWKRRQRPGATAPPPFREMALPTLLSAPWVAEIALPTGTVLRFSAQADLAGLRPLLADLVRS